MSPKSRDYVNSSALGSYFGVGFNSPNDQIEIDLGHIEPEFDEAAQDRMALGRFLEDSAINYFENKLGITVTDRNETLITGLDGRLVGKIDGKTELNGIETVVEMKISNSQSGPFTENMGYILQCQAYMLMTQTKQALLCGLYQGKPIMKIVKRDEQIIDDITRMVTFIHEVLVGINTFDNYPTDILEQYSKVQLLEIIDNLAPKDEEDLMSLAVLKDKKKVLEDQISAIETRLKENYDSGKFENDLISFSISQNERKGGLDEMNLSIWLSANGIDIDLEQFRKPTSRYKTLKIKSKR
jgi:predicted phage-related endonuclease